jgi:hypothetical protein
VEAPDNNILQEHDLEQYVTTIVEEPTNNAGISTFKKSQEKDNQIIFNSVKDNIMPAMTLLMIVKDCMDSLVNLYEKQAPSQKRTLKHKPKYLNMEKGESIASLSFQDSPDQRSTFGHRGDSGR